MIGSEIKSFVEDGLLDGQTIEETLFYNLLNSAKELVENERDWVFLRATDTTKTASQGDTFLTEKELPPYFAVDLSMYLVDSSNNPERCYPIAYEDRYFAKDSQNRYFINFASSTFGITGNRGQSKTIHLVYKRYTPDITSTSSWLCFPTRFDKLLGFIVSGMYKGGVDYDEINIKQALSNQRDGLLLWESLKQLDSRIKQREMGEAYEAQGQYNSDGLPTGDVKEFPLGLM